MPTLPYQHNANCHLYCGDNGRVVSDSRIGVQDNDNDFLTRRAQGMTPEEFRRFQNEQVEQEVTASFIAKIRHAIITQNKNGEFLESRISPCVFTDDWVLKATHFIKKVMEGKQQQQSGGGGGRRRVKIQLEMQEKKNGSSVEGWLQVRVNNSYSLPLVMFTNRTLQACLDKIITAAHKVLTDMEFSSTPGANTIIAVAPLQPACKLWQAHKEEEAAASAMNNEATNSNNNFTNESFNCIRTLRQIWDSTVVYVPRKKARRN